MTQTQQTYGNTIIQMDVLRKQGRKTETNALVSTILGLQQTIKAERVKILNNERLENVA